MLSWRLGIGHGTVIRILYDSTVYELATGTVRKGRYAGTRLLTMRATAG
jgi:hypothetical protein